MWWLLICSLPKRNQNASFAEIVSPFDIGAVQGVPQDIEGSLGDLTPPSGDQDISVPHNFKRTPILTSA